MGTMHESHQFSTVESIPIDEWTRVAAILGRLTGLQETDLELLKRHRSRFTVDIEDLTQRLLRVINEHPELPGYPRLVADKAALADQLARHLAGIFDAAISREWMSQALALGDYYSANRVAPTLISVIHGTFLDYLETQLASGDPSGIEKLRLQQLLGRVVRWNRDLQLAAYDSQRPLENFIAAQRDVGRLISLGVPTGELFKQVCRVAVERAGLDLAWIGRVGASGGADQVIAAAGPAWGYMATIQAAIEAGAPRASGPFGRCAASGRSVVVTALSDDPGYAPWRDAAAQFGLRSAAALPLKEATSTAAVLMVYSTQPAQFTPETAALLEDVARDISATLTARKHQIQLERLRNGYGALSNINQLIAHSPGQQELFRRAVQILAAQTGVELAALLGIDRPDGDSRLCYSAGPNSDRAQTMIDVLERHLDAGFATRAWRSRQPVIVNRVADHIEAAEARRELNEYGVGGAVALPIFDPGDLVAQVLVMITPSTDLFTADVVYLLQQIAGDISFSLSDMGRRAQLSRLQGYYAALAEIGALVAGDHDISAVLQRACDLVVRYTGSAATYIATLSGSADEGASIAGLAGTASAFIKSLDVAIEADQPGGNGMFGRVYRRDHTLVVNDLLHDTHFQHMAEGLAQWNLQAGVGVPLRVGGVCRGVLVVAATQHDYYGSELVELIERMAEAIGSAMARADERAIASRYQSFYRALSSINELIARDPEPALVYQEAARILAQVDRGLAVHIAEVDVADERMRIVASAGAGIDDKLAEEFRATALSTQVEQAGGQGIAAYAFRARHTVVWTRVTSATPLPIHSALRSAMGTRSLLGAPIFANGICTAVLIISAREVDFFRPDLVALSERLVANIGFALQAYRQREALAAQAFTDALTGLPNRALYEDRLRMAASQVDREGGQVAALLIDLDRFKDVNDRFGHHIGDQVLKSVAERIMAVLRGGDTLARLGGDELVVMLPLDDVMSDIGGILERVQDAIRSPLPMDEELLAMTASIGVALYPQDTDDPNLLLRRADLAMYRVKSQGGNGWAPYEAALEERVLRRNAVRNRMAEALEQREFEVFYQPIVDLASGVITGMEALIRWRSSELGLVSPAEFVPLAEETGLIVPIGEWVLREACLALTSLHDAGYPGLRVAVNLSTRQFGQPDLIQRVAAIVQETGIEPHALELEITESAAMEHVDEVLEVIERLHGLGVAMALDDFGTGYSSLNYLKDFRIDYLKVDRSFVNGLPNDVGSSAIARTVINLAQGLSMGVIAEGIETADQWTTLRDWNCQEGQGYLFSVPLAKDDFTWLVRNHRTLPVE